MYVPYFSFVWVAKLLETLSSNDGFSLVIFPAHITVSSVGPRCFGINWNDGLSELFSIAAMKFYGSLLQFLVQRPESDSA